MARAKKRAAQAHEEFVFRIKSPSVAYLFGIQHARWDPAPFFEFLDLSMIGDCLYPPRVKGRVCQIKVRPNPVLGDKTLKKGSPSTPAFIGYVKTTKSVFEASVYLPPDVFWNTANAIASGLFKSMLFNGPVETRSMTKLIALSFHGDEFDPVAYVG